MADVEVVPRGVAGPMATACDCPSNQTKKEDWLALARREAHEQGEWLRAAQCFAGGPLRECGAENLRAGAFGQHFDAEAVEHLVAAFVETEIGGAQLREMRAEGFG